MSQQKTFSNVMEIRHGIRPGLGGVKGTDAAAPVQVVLNCLMNPGALI
jgi:hypothetical protein